MSNFRGELESLSQGNEQQEMDRGGNSSDISAEVENALKKFHSEQEQSQKEAQHQEFLEKERQMQMNEERALAEAKRPVIDAINKESSEDPEFKKLLQENGSLPASILDFCATVAEPDEAPAILRELASNEDYKTEITRAKTQMGVSRVLRKIRKDVLTGGLQGKVPDMLRKNIPTYNENQNASDDDFDWEEEATRLGIR